jgi:hypothetical protein
MAPWLSAVRSPTAIVHGFVECVPVTIDQHSEGHGRTLNFNLHFGRARLRQFFIRQRTRAVLDGREAYAAEGRQTRQADRERI